MSLKGSRKSQLAQAGDGEVQSQEVQSQEAQAPEGGAEPQPPAQAAQPASPAAAAQAQAQAPGSSAGGPPPSPEVGPSEMEPQPGPSGLWPGASAASVEPQEGEAASGAAGSAKPRFRVGDQVLSLHGSLLYEARCLRVAEAACGTAAQAQAGSLTYLVHYTGWNKNWDEWVPASRLFEYSEANLARQSQLLEAHQAQLPPGRRGRAGARKTPGLQQRGAGRPGPAAAGEGAAPVGEGAPAPSEAAGPSSPAQPGPALRRKRVRGEAAAAAGAGAAAGAQARETAAGRADVKVEIPDRLKPWLVDDWELVTKQRQLFQLPARKSVDSILEEYIRARTAPGAALGKAFAAVEVAAGIKEYFNVMLGTQLLYKFERPQYAEVLAQRPDAPLTSLYGAPHLLRLFVRIGAMLAYTPLDERSRVLLLSHLDDFVSYLAEQRALLFSVGDYSPAPPEYQGSTE